MALAREALSRLAGTPDAATVAVSGLDCALALEKADPARPGAIAEMEAAVRHRLADAKSSADAAWPAYYFLIRARRDVDDAAGAKKDAEACASLLERRAAEAKTPEERAVCRSLPPGGRRDFQSKPLKEKLEALSRSAASPGTA